MSFMEWREELSINISEIDEQHKSLINTVNKLHDSILTGKGKEVLAGILADLIEYAEVHFSDEEQLMQTHGYHEYHDHKQEHDDLKKQVMDFVGQFENGNISICTDLLLFLEDWLLIHMSDSDKKYGKYLNDMGII